MICDLEKPNQIGPAIGNASIVICCIGASEKEIFDISGPYRIDYMATKNLVEAGKKTLFRDLFVPQNIFLAIPQQSHILA